MLGNCTRNLMLVSLNPDVDKFLVVIIDFIAVVLSCHVSILGQFELRVPFFAAQNAPPFGLHRSSKFDLNPEVYN